MNIRNFFAVAILATSTATFTFAQDNLVNALKDNKSEDSKTKFKFTHVINIEQMPVKNQGSSGTCWSYCTNSFLESEMIKAGKAPVNLSYIYSARNVYLEKGRQYVKMHGATALGDGGSLHDVIDMYRLYGAMPEEVYKGLNYGTKLNDFSEMAALRESFLETVIKPKKGKLTPNWFTAYQGIIDAYLGTPPETFKWNGKEYTPKTFASQVVGINPDNYIELSSFMEYPLYQKFILPIPDNWSLGQVYNVKLPELTEIIDYALQSGYTINWATDVSEKYFSWKNGVAYVPEKDFEDMTKEEKDSMFSGPKPERIITETMRQEAFNNYTTTDDHGMHIVGTAKDQNGKDYYIVKNSWGESNDYKGYLYVTKAYVQFKSTAILLNKAGIPKHILKKINIK
jgi:bleomycin hydrolase